jgi:hypothetical protein
MCNSLADLFCVLYTDNELTCRELVLDAIAIEHDSPLQVRHQILKQR